MTREEIDTAFSNHAGPRWLGDCEYIASVIAKEYGCRITVAEAETFWLWHSDVLGAGWLSIDMFDTSDHDRQEIISCFSSFVEQHQ